MAKLFDWVKQTVSGTPGTGAITLGSAVSTFITFANAGIQNGETVYYTVVDGTNREAGIGTYSTTGPTLTRTWIQRKLESGTYTENPGTGLSLTSAAVVGCSPVAATHNFRGTLVKHNADQSVTVNAVYYAAFNTEVYDTGGFHDTVTNNSRITIPSGKGIKKVRLFGSVTGTFTGSGIFAAIFIQKNGADFDGMPIQDASTIAAGVWQKSMQSAIVDVVDGDYFQLGMYYNPGGFTLSTSSKTCFGLEVIE